MTISFKENWLAVGWGVRLTDPKGRQWPVRQKACDLAIFIPAKICLYGDDGSDPYRVFSGFPALIEPLAIL